MPDYSQPFPVRITVDCKPVLKRLDGEFGMCMGLYNPDTLEPDPRGYPLIRTQSGRYRWGFECWWAPADAVAHEPVERLRELTAAYVAGLRERMEQKASQMLDEYEA